MALFCRQEDLTTTPPNTHTHGQNGHQLDDKPLPEPMLSQLTDADMLHSGGDELIPKSQGVNIKAVNRTGKRDDKSSCLYATLSTSAGASNLYCDEPE